VAYLRVDDVDAFHDRAFNAGAEIMKPPTDEPWGMREFGVRSPDGHRFMLGQPLPTCSTNPRTSTENTTSGVSCWR